MLNNRKNKFEELLAESEALAEQIKSGTMLSAEQAQSWAGLNARILAAPDLSAFWAAIGAAFEAFIAKLYPGDAAPKWTKVGKLILQIGAFLVAAIKQFKNLKAK